MKVNHVVLDFGEKFQDKQRQLNFFYLPFCKKFLIKEEDTICLLINNGSGLTTLKIFRHKADIEACTDL